ncbi:dimethylamine monooxygenase subunit DmmA family protein [Peribacillus sp. SCS-155]|uniref:dimethylamine monooxygenase subunit DmmA family protein n=1 Tax=Peribacillus sedimenti TaxID=3115297 RepID=UPI0039069408
MTNIKQPAFIEGKRKYLFCADEKGIGRLQQVIQQAVNNNASFELVYAGGDVDMERISCWLHGQKMGTYLYIAAAWGTQKLIRELAEEIGFTDEEIQGINLGDKPQRVYCCRCHYISETQQPAAEPPSLAACSSCGLMLEISDHYSSLHDAYLGHVAKL